MSSKKSRGRPPQPEDVKIKKIIETMSKQSNPNEKLRRRIKYMESKAIPKATSRLATLKSQLNDIKAQYESLSNVSAAPSKSVKKQADKEDEEDEERSDVDENEEHSDVDENQGDEQNQADDGQNVDVEEQDDGEENQEEQSD